MKYTRDCSSNVCCYPIPLVYKRTPFSTGSVTCLRTRIWNDHKLYVQYGKLAHKKECNSTCVGPLMGIKK